jgi:hypothetical protein
MHIICPFLIHGVSPYFNRSNTSGAGTANPSEVPELCWYCSILSFLCSIWSTIVLFVPFLFFIVLSVLWINYDFWLHLWYLFSVSVDHCIVCSFSFFHCIVCPSNYDFWLHLWYLFSVSVDHCIVCSFSFFHCIVCPLN